MPPRRLSVLLILAATLASPVWAQTPAGIEAVRASSAVQIDGRLDDAAWSAARPYDRFVETFPQDGKAAPDAYRTEVRVLYDNEFLYVGVRCHDPSPKQIVAQLSRRDTNPASDLVQVALDPERTGNNGYTFTLNAAGVQRDTILYGDVNTTETWDSVWDGSSQIDEQGWTAEFAIPLRVLRFSEQRGEWGVHVRRLIPHTRQTLDSTYLPRNANRSTAGGLVVSRFGSLTGMVGIDSARAIELAPYVAARLTERPQFLSDPTRPTPTLLVPTADVGLDLAMSLTSSINLNVAVNPDFGQVEADQLIQNVGTSELFFPERRPFFTQGLDLFQPVGAEYGAQQQLFYSRRIGIVGGRLVPILAAAKVSGSVREGTEVGLLDAVVMGAGNPALENAYGRDDLTSFEQDPDRRYQFQLRQPFTFGPNNALPARRPVTTNYFAGVVRHQLTDRARVGVMATSALPLEPRCRPENFDDGDPSTDDGEPYTEAACAADGANAVSLDFDVRSKNGEWGAFGQASLSQAIGGPEGGRRLPDGTDLKAGDLGTGFTFRMGKLGGEPFRFDVNGTFLPPNLELNDLGWQPLSNYQWYQANLSYVRPSGFGPFRSASVRYTLDAFNWSADGRWIRRGNNHWVNANLQLPSFDTLYLSAGYENPEYDVREIPFTGIAVERQADVYLALGIDTDQNRPLFASANILGIHILGESGVPSFNGFQGFAAVTWRPTPRLETQFGVEGARRASGTRFAGVEGEDAVFGTQFPSFLSATLRQQLVIAPRLTLQAYAQYFAANVRYGEFFRAPMNREFISIRDLVPFDDYDGDPSGEFTGLNVNLVLRWEYRLGSTLFAVYTREQQGSPGAGSGPAALFAGPVSQTAMVKWSYWWDV